MRVHTLKFFLKQLYRTSSLGRKSKVLIQLTTDITISFCCFILALWVGNESLLVITDPIVFLGMIISITSGIIAFNSFGLYKSLVRFVNNNILIIIFKGVLIGSSVLFLYVFITRINIQFTVPFIYGLILFLLIGGTRFVMRRLFHNTNQKTKKTAVIYGAGEAGRELLNALSYNYEIQPVAFIDDNSNMQGLSIGGCFVYHNNAFAKINKKYDVELILLAIPTISRKQRKKIINMFKNYNLEIKSVPKLSKILSGQALISELRPITPEMLLGRDPITPDKDLMQRNILNKSVMITGAGGSIGSELSRQALAQGPMKIILFEVSEAALYQINAELLDSKKQTNSLTIIVPVLGSICDKKHLENTIKTFGITSIYHAAAYKHVPLVEDNIIEGIKNNAFGTLTLAQTATQLGVENFTLISTDKAVRPTNVMGASKRIAELICQSYTAEPVKTKFSIVRFGNVLGSSGSVIPLFQKQIEAGGPVTVTHPEITRYFMTIPEAAELVIQASAMAKGGDVFVLDMGEPIKIADLAGEMIKLTGLKPYLLDHPNQIFQKLGYIGICITGLRNGEKLYEELLIENSPQPTEHPRIMKANEVSLPIAEMTHLLSKLDDSCKTFNNDMILNFLKELPLEFNHNNALFNNISTRAPST